METKNEPPKLPQSWIWTTLSQVSEIGAGYGFPETYQGKKDGEIPFFKVSDLGEASRKGDIKLIVANNYVSSEDCRKIRARPLKSGTIVFAKIGGAIKLNRHAFLAQDSLIDNNMMGIYCLPAVLASKLTYYFLRTLNLEEFSRATTVPSIRKSDVEQIHFPLPPLPEQHRIVAKIEQLFSDLDAGVAALQNAKQQLKRYRQSVLKAAVEGKLTAAWRAAKQDKIEPASELLKRVRDGRRESWGNQNGRSTKPYIDPPTATAVDASVPQDWSVATLEELTSAVRVICYGILMPKDDVADGVLYVKVKDIKNDKVNLQSLNRTSYQIASKFARASLRAGDLLLAIRGTYGRVAEVPPQLEGGNITQDTARLAISPLIDRHFIALHLRSDTSQNYFKRVARGVAVKGVNIADVRLCPINLPPIQEQEQIVAEVERRLSVVDQIEKTIDASLLQSERLRQSILKKAFSGKLVPQDPTDEPAEKLLERIRANRENHTVKPKQLPLLNGAPKKTRRSKS